MFNRKEYNKQYSQQEKNKIKRHLWYKNYYLKNKKRIKLYNKYYAFDHREKLIKKRQEKRLIVLNHYSKGKMCCNCCGEKELKFLTIDHINNDGAQHRKLNKNNIDNFIIQNHFPEDFQILCYNCNCGKSINNGVCPHLVIHTLPIDR